jgi:hypothetical protein
MRWRLFSFRPGAFALVCIAVYFGATVLSVMIAHALLIARPDSDLPQRIITPVARTLEFLDAHWKSILVLIAPFVAPVARGLVPRLRKVGSIELDPVPLEPVGVREKPPQEPRGDRL